MVDEKNRVVYNHDILKPNGSYDLDNVYTVIPDWEEIIEREKAEAVLTFNVSLYDDFIINIKDIFKNIINY